MSTTTLTHTPPTSTQDRLRSVLRADAVVTAGVGALAVFGPTSWYGDTAGWLVRTVGVTLLVVGADLALASRWSGSRLRLAGTVAAELAFAWVAATAAVLTLVDLPAAGVEVLALVAVATLVFAVTETKLVRALR